MAQMRQVSKAQGTIKISRFGGVDFSSNNTKAEVHRSPDAVNMISDDLSYPVKRTGYKRVVANPFEGKINGMYKYVSTVGEKSHLLVHVGSTLYRFFEDGREPQQILQENTGSPTFADHSSFGFNMNGKLYILDGSNYWFYDGDEIVEETIVMEGGDKITQAILPGKLHRVVGGYIPITSQGRTPGGTGAEYEGRNLLYPWQKNEFNGDGTVAYHLSCPGNTQEGITVEVNGAVVDKSCYSYNKDTGVVTFNSSNIPPAGPGNVLITWDAKDPEAEKDDYDKIMGCTIYSLFGGKNDTRIFLSGNPKYRNVDWQSGLYDPTYFPADGFTRVGSNATAIVGYARQYDTQIIVKEDNDVDATQYLRTFDIDNNGHAYYPLQQGAQGAGAVAKRSFANLGDVPLFLSKSGVYGVMGTSVALQRSIQVKSTLINARLLEEPGLENAVAIAFDNKYHLCVNGHCYVADGNQRYSGEGGGVQYEWYYWENILAVCFLEHDGHLYFGTGDGRICRFMKPDEFSPYNDDGGIIPCRWTTPFLDFGAGNYYKTIHRLYVTLKPFTRAAADIYYSTDRSFPEKVATQKLRIFNFEDIDFNDFSFNTLTNPVTAPVFEKARRVVSFQLDIRNGMEKDYGDSIPKDESMGVYGIQIDFQKNAKLKEV